MIQFEVNGEMLDVPEGLEIQLQKTNMLFAFDQVKCERSVSFNLPATPKNDRIFKLAKWVANTGTGMRRRYAAQMQAGVVVKDGYLYVSEYDEGQYEAVFVTGELLGLQAIRDAGKIGEIISPTETTTYGSNTTPSIGKNSVFSGIVYDAGDGNVIPSVCLQTIITNALQALGVSWSAPAAVQYVRYVPAEANGIQKTEDEFSSTTQQLSPSGTYPTVYLLTSENFNSFFGVSMARVRRFDTPTGGTATQYTGRVRQFVAMQALKLSFPTDWDDNLFVGHFINGDSNLVTEFQFYGGRTFDENGVVSGESLRGRTVEIARGDVFTIIDKACYVNTSYSGGTIKGWAFVDANFSLVVEGGDIEMYSRIRLADNLPDLTVIELLKIMSAICGGVIYYDGSAISFDALEMVNWDILDLTGRVSKSGQIARRFADYARRNIIDFASGESVKENDRIKTVYAIENDNLAEEKTLQEIPYSEGESAGAYGGRTLARIPNGLAALADADVTAANVGMLRVALNKNEGVQELCNASTCMQVQARMSMLEFEHLQPRTLLYYKGVQYVWTAAKWSREWATFNLSKTAQIVVWYGITQSARDEIISAYGLQVWQQLLAYVKTNTSIVQYINEHPLDAALYGRAYIQDGLILQLDRGFGCGTSSWEDFIANIVYTGHNINIADNAPVFDGSSSYYAGAPLNSSYDNCTIEIVFKRNNNNTSMIFCDGNTSRGLIIVYSGGKYTTCAASTSADATPTAISNSQVGAISILSSAKDVRYENGSLLTNSGTDWWSGRDQSYIGCRVTDGVLDMRFSGSIYTIRIYNRLLSSNEMRANQAIDAQRFL